MPPVTRTRARVALIAALTVALGGCAAVEGDPVATTTSADPGEALVALLGAEASATGGTLHAGEDAVREITERVPTDAAAALAAAIDGAGTTGVRASARGRSRVARLGPSIPGVHTPLVALDEPVDSSSQVNGVDVQVTGRTTLEVADQTSSYSSTVARTGRAGDAEVLQDERSTRVDVPACVADASTGWDGEVRHERTTEAPVGDTRVRLENTMRAATHGDADGDAVALTGIRIDVTRTVTHADGSTTVERGTMSGSAPAVTLDTAPGGDATAGIRVSDGSAWLTASSGDVFLSAVVALVPEIRAALRVAADAHGEAGLCVRVVADPRGVTTLAGGESTPVDGRVVDTRTGETLEGVPISASGDRGTPSPGQFSSNGTTTFTAAGGAPPSALELTASTPRGGDSATVRFSDGWAFSGVVLSVSVDDVSASQTWSGFVCGNPLVDPWTFTQTADGIGDVTFEQVPYPFDVRPEGWGQVPMIEPLPDADPEDPPFRLYIDDVEPPEVAPRNQRVEVDVHPAGAMYCG